MTKFEKFKKNYDEAIENINSMLVSEHEYDQECCHLVNWLLNTQHNPYGIFVTEGAAGSMGSAEGFSGLCGVIHHALTDDGDISFPVVNGQPRIAFVWKNEDNIEKYVLTDQERVWRDTPNERISTRWVSPTIVFLKDAYEFTKAFDEYELGELKRCFLTDAVRQGEEFSIEHYKDKVGFTLDWLVELPAMKEKYKVIWG